VFPPALGKADRVKSGNPEIRRPSWKKGAVFPPAKGKRQKGDRASNGKSSTLGQAGKRRKERRRGGRGNRREKGASYFPEGTERRQERPSRGTQVRTMGNVLKETIRKRETPPLEGGGGMGGKRGCGTNQGGGGRLSAGPLRDFRREGESQPRKWG